jgi:hypothetical protein
MIGSLFDHPFVVSVLRMFVLLGVLVTVMMLGSVPVTIR